MTAARMRGLLPLVASMPSVGALLPRQQQPIMQDPFPQSPTSRSIILRESSNSVSGSYPLYDLLSISTQSGSISIDVTPHSASSEHPSRPATLELSAKSGSIHATISEGFVEHLALPDGSTVPSDAPPSYEAAVGEQVNDRPVKIVKTPGIPSREYITSVSSQSGSISGSFPLGARTSLESRSGSINGVQLVVMPMNGSSPRELKTSSRDGSQSIRIVENDFWAAKKGAWWNGMLSKHDGRSGSMNIEYPDSWEGKIQVETNSGSIDVTGRGVQIIRKEKGIVYAQKGDGDGKVVVYARSGSVNLRFG